MSLIERVTTYDREKSGVRPLRSRDHPSSASFYPSLDQFLAILMIVPVGFVLLVLLPIVLAFQGRPFLFGSRRVGMNGQHFTMWKIRTMHVSNEPEMVMGAGVRDLVTPFGVWLRRTRLDELPQVLNLLRGDMVFIGARPPLPKHACSDADVFGPILRSPPGLTGLATVTLCGLEEVWLASEQTSQEVEAKYRSKCLPRKHRLDRFYADRRSPVLAVYIIGLTALRGRRARRLMRALRRRAGQYLS